MYFFTKFKIIFSQYRLVFSHSLTCLDLIEHILRKSTEKYFVNNPEEKQQIINDNNLDISNLFSLGSYTSLYYTNFLKIF